MNEHKQNIVFRCRHVIGFTSKLQEHKVCEQNKWPSSTTMTVSSFGTDFRAIQRIEYKNRTRVEEKTKTTGIPISSSIGDSIIKFLQWS